MTPHTSPITAAKARQSRSQLQTPLPVSPAGIYCSRIIPFTVAVRLATATIERSAPAVSIVIPIPRVRRPASGNWKHIDSKL